MSSTTHSRELFGDDRLLATPPALVGLAAIAAVMTGVGLWMAFYWAPLEKEMGFVQKIFYFHVPSAWNMLLAVLIMAYASIAYLVKKSDRWDRLSDATVELAIVFGIMVIVSGPLWARKSWGVFWVWDVRLTSTLILVLTLVACKIARQYAGPNSKQIAAGLAVFAVIDAVFVYVCVKFWNTTHPPLMTTQEGGLEPRMRTTLFFCAITFLVIFACMLWARLRLGKLRAGLDRLHMQVTEAGFDD